MRKGVCIVGVLLQTVLSAAEPLGLLGDTAGFLGRPPYAVLIRTDLTIVPLSGSGWPSTGNMFSVAINDSGIGLIGGHTGGQPYAAFVTPEGVVNPINWVDLPSAVIYSVAINSTGTGLLANHHYDAAFVYPSGRVTPLPLGSSDITLASNVALNNAGIGLIGGILDVGAYAAVVTEEGTVSSLSLEGIVTSGNIYSTAINDAGLGLIGGIDYSVSSYAYAAIVDARDTSFPTLYTLLGSASPASTRSTVNSVAINQNGVGLIGGGSEGDGSIVFQVAISEEDPSHNTLTAVSGIDFSTVFDIYSVDINDSGIGLIGGYTNSGAPILALVSANGVARALSSDSLPSLGAIESVAINQAGVGLIGGYSRDSEVLNLYAALVAPDGTVTQLPLYHVTADFPHIKPVSVSINNTLLLNAVPSSMGSSLNVMYSQLAAGSALTSHFAKTKSVQTPQTTKQEALSLLASAHDNSSVLRQNFSKQKYAAWGSPFGSWISQKANGQNPSTSNQIGGFLTGFDYQPQDFLVGAAFGYAFDYTHYGSSVGHGKLNEEMLCLYGAWSGRQIQIYGALWGGYYQLYNERHTLSFITSKANTQGGLFTPHLELSSLWTLSQKRWLSIEPFAMFDWVNNWQASFTETGSSGLNLVMPGLYNSLLRSEVGCRFYEEINKSWGKFVIEEKVSYVNQKPFQMQAVQTSFVASASTFPIAIGNGSTENLFGTEIQATFVSQAAKWPYFSLEFQGEWGSAYQSYFLSLEIGKKF